MRFRIFWGPYWGSLPLGNCHLFCTFSPEPELKSQLGTCSTQPFAVRLGEVSKNAPSAVHMQLGVGGTPSRSSCLSRYCRINSASCHCMLPYLHWAVWDLFSNNPNPGALTIEIIPTLGPKPYK